MNDLFSKERLIRELRSNMHHVGVCKALLKMDFDMTEEEVDDLIRQFSKEAQTIASGSAKQSLMLVFEDLKELWGSEDEQSDD